MNKIALILVAFCFATVSSFAQNEALDKNAALLFNKRNTQLTNAEKNNIFNQTGFELAANGTQFYMKANPEQADVPFDTQIYPLDLNFDGIEEIAIVYGNITSSGKAGKSTLLCVKDMEGHYRTNFGFPGTLIFLNLNSFTLPDVLVRQPEYGFPIWRWNGDSYLIHKQMDNKELSKMRITYLADASKRYTNSFNRE